MTDFTVDPIILWWGLLRLTPITTSSDKNTLSQHMYKSTVNITKFENIGPSVAWSAGPIPAIKVSI